MLSGLSWLSAQRPLPSPSPPFLLQVFKMLSNKESLDQIIVATPGLSSDPIALGKHGTELEETRVVGEGETERGNSITIL